jgi:hypothetical protein
MDRKLGDADWPTTADEASAIAEYVMPGKLRKWIRDDWAASVLAVAHLFGPVPARRWKWSAFGGKTALEVWDVRAADGDGVEPMVEVSFKVPEEAEAAEARKALRLLLAAHPRWLLTEDMLKTDRVLHRYGPR